MSVAELTGIALKPSVLVVERGPVQVFATAVKDEHSAYRSVTAAAELGFGDVPVPPTFLFSLAHWGEFGELQPEAPEGSMTLVELIGALRGGRQGVILHGGQEFEYPGTVWAGDVLDVTGVVESATEKDGTPERPGMSVLVVRTDYHQRATGTLAASARGTYLFRPKPA